MENPKFVNFGLGQMTEEERRDLIQIGAIVNLNGIDHIACDGFCVNTYKNGEATCVMEGDKFQCEMERDKIKGIKPDAKVEVKSYPKTYFEYINRRFPKDC
jgi:hypothetical protein